MDEDYSPCPQAGSEPKGVTERVLGWDRTGSLRPPDPPVLGALSFEREKASRPPLPLHSSAGITPSAALGTRTLRSVFDSRPGGASF